MNKTNNSNLEKIAAITIPGYAEASADDFAELDVACWTANSLIRRAYAYGTKRGALETRKATEEIVRSIANKHMHMETVEQRGSDDLDFYTVSVGEVRAAMLAAVNA